MNIKKIIGWIIKTPLILLVLATAGIGFYAASGGVEGFRISYGAPIVLSSLIVLYCIGSFMTSNKSTLEDKSNYLDTNNSNYDEETQRAIEQYEE